jgi:hypothetical protein
LQDEGIEAGGGGLAELDGPVGLELSFSLLPLAPGSSGGDDFFFEDLLGLARVERLVLKSGMEDHLQSFIAAIGGEMKDHLHDSQGDSLFFDELPGIFGELEESLAEIDPFGGLIEAIADFFTGESRLLDEEQDSAGLFDGVDVLPLEVFDHHEDEGFGVAEITDDARDALEIVCLGGSPSALAGDDLVLIGGDRSD